MSLRSWRWAVTSARDLCAVHMAFDQHVSELKWMESLSLRAAAEQTRRNGLTSGTPATFAGVADRLLVELSPKGPVSAERVADLFRLWLSGTERLAALLGPGQAALREFPPKVQRTARAWSTAILPSAPAAVAPAPESEAAHATAGANRGGVWAVGKLEDAGAQMYGAGQVDGKGS
ncbi:hypothetical protein ACSSS7_007304 [Eimeria intestinalis]